MFERNNPERRTPMVIGYKELLGFVQAMLPSFRVTRQRNLALLALGILQVRDGHLTISEIARAVPGRSDHWYKFKRIRRFLSNLKWSPARCFSSTLCFVLSRFHPGPYLPVIIDQSTISGKWEVLWASVPFRGRALPISFRLFTYNDIRQDPQGSQNRLEEQFIRSVITLLPPQPTPLFLFDRGYARVSLLRFLDRLPLKYVIRARKKVWVRFRQVHEGLLENVEVSRGALLWWPRATYHLQHHYPVNLAITLNATTEEPWYLLTNLARASSAVRWYERRFRCEELFRDVKDQLKLESIRTQNADRICRLLFGILVAHLALSLIGAAAQRVGLRRKVCKDRISLAWMALRLLKMPQFLKPDLVTRALFSWSWSLSYESG
jgi:hypothetical protein